MEQSGWLKVGTEQEIGDKKPFVAKIGDRDVLVFRSGKSLFACSNKCTHYGGKLSDGLIRGTTVICPLHNAHFELSTGAMTSPPGIGDLPSYDVKSENGDVYVKPRAGARRSAPKGKKSESVLVIGAGAAADMAADTLRSEGYDGRITLVTKEKGVPYDRPNLSKDYLAGEAKPEWLPIRGADFYREHGIELVTERSVVAFDPAAKSATLSDGSRLRGDKVLLATGSHARRLAALGEQRSNCFYLRSLDDAQAIVAAIERGARKVVVIGSSFIGLEVSSSLRARGIETHVVAPDKRPLVGVFGTRIADRIRALHESKGVQFHLETMPVRLEGGERLVLSNGSSLEADLFIVGVGATPAVDYLAQSDLVRDGAVPVNERLETKYPGVYAAGDIAIVPDPRGGEGVRIEHWVVAQRLGMHAAKAMLGSSQPYAEPPFFWTMQYGSSFKYVGHAKGHYDVFYRGDVEAGPFAAGYYVGGRLVAVATLQRNRDVMIAGELLKLGRSVPPDQFEKDEDLEQFLD